MVGPQLVLPRTDAQLPTSTDPLGEVLQLLQLDGVLYCNATLSEPWGIEIPAIEGVMNVEVVTSGSCWLELDDEAPVFMPERSLALIPRGRRHRLRGRPGDAVTPLEQIPIERGGERVEIMRFGGGGRSTQVTYCGVRFDPYLAARLIEQLPELLLLRADPDEDDRLNLTVEATVGATVRLLAAEAESHLPGSETLTTRLADILVIQAIRVWLERARAEQQGWIVALHDRQIGAVLAAMHRRPEEPWNLSSLSRVAGMSRSAFSARFAALVEEPPLHYLTHLRIRLAERELCRCSDPLMAIAERVGYHSEPAFNRAFKRVVGLPPGEVRKRYRESSAS
ncbi:MAG: AraC family transcriptional regulator [Pseudomonadota bacterium]